MKNFKKLVPALCLLLVSAMLVGTSTYAWFSMNTQVTATGMQVKAQAEGGIVISNEAKTAWNASATASHSAVAELIPTSTADASKWYHAVSDDANNAKAGQDANKYTTLAITETDGVGAATVGTEDKNVYLLNKFYIQSSADAIDLTNKNPSKLLINEVTVSGIGTSTTLDASLRIMIKIGDTTVIYAPVTGATTSYKVAASASNTVCKTTDKNVETSITTIPAYTAAGTNALEASVYVYFEGEDTNCKSANITATLDTLQVTVRFGTTAIE